MGSTGVIWGPPGTGKTTASVMVANKWFEAGARPGEVAYLSFTVAAADEAAGRIGGPDLTRHELRERFPLFRTIHSLAYMGMGTRLQDVRVLTPADMARFSKATGYEGKFAAVNWEDLNGPRDFTRETHWDKASAAYQVGRLSACSGGAMEATRKAIPEVSIPIVGYLDEGVYRAFVERYEEFKQSEALVDFTDMLEFALTKMPPMDEVRHVLIDEAQDVGPCMMKIVDRVLGAAERTVWVGDPDQAIYGFSGASAKLLIERSREADWRVLLRQTHRFGQGIADFSDKVIRRCRERLDSKDVVGLPGKHGSVEISGEFKPVADERLVLHRHVAGCQAIARQYIEAGLPFRNERGRDPLSAGNQVRGWVALESLASGSYVPFGDAKLVIDEFIPSLTPTDRTRLVVHGAKKRIEEMSGHAVSLQDLVSINVLTPDGAAVVQKRRYDLMSNRENLEYYGAVVKNGYSLDARWPIITTIHGSKGRQAKNVTVFSETSRRCWDDHDGEHRLAYVAATRTQGDLTICADRVVDWAEVQYEYPVEEVKRDG